jgi:lipoate-protein ligase A
MALHGEYKHPGGKLVVIDLSVNGGALTDVHVSGDFFLEPPEALDAIVAALEGAPANASADELAGLISSRLPDDTVMLGFDANSVAVAVRRAVDDGSPRERV